MKRKSMYKFINSLLELLAQLIEAKQADWREAARIVRSAKVPEKTAKK